MWMSHPSLPGVVKNVADNAFYGGWDALGWVSTSAPVSTDPVARWPVTEESVLALVEGAIDAAGGVVTSASVDTKIAAQAVVDSLTYATMPFMATYVAEQATGAIVTGAGNGTNDDRAAIAAADTAAAGGLAVTLRPGTYRVAANLTVAAPVVMLPGAKIKPDSGVVVILAGGVDAPRSQVFDHSAGGVVAPRRTPFYHPSWWGPVNTADDTAAWVAMTAAMTAATIVDTGGSGNSLGQRILAPAGVNKFWGVSLTNAHLICDRGVSTFAPAGVHTSGTMLTVNEWVSIDGGYWRTNTGTEAVKLIEVLGGRSQVSNAFIAPVAAGAIGIYLGNLGGSITPVLRDIRILSTARVGTGIVVASSDAVLSNIWIGNCAVGIDWQRGSAQASALHIWGCTTGMTGTPDGCVFSGLYIETCVGWGVDFNSCDRNVFTDLYFWANGTTVGTGGMRILYNGANNCSNNVISGGVFDDNTGVGLLIDGATGTEISGLRFTSATVTGGGSPVCTYGLKVVAAIRTRASIRGNTADHITAVYDDTSGTATGVDLGTRRKVLAADQTFTSTTGPATVLAIPVDKGERWVFHGVLFVFGNASQVGDMRVRVQATGTTGCVGWFTLGSLPAANTTSTSAASVNPANASQVVASAGGALSVGLTGSTYQGVPVDGFLDVGTNVAVTQTLDVQVAQLVSDAVGVTVYAGSWLEATRVR